MDTNLLADGEPAGRIIDPPTPEQSLLAHLILGKAAYEAYITQRIHFGDHRAAWDDLDNEVKYSWALAAHAVLSVSIPYQDHEAAVLRVIAEPVAAGDEPPPLLPPPPKVQDDGEPPPIYPPPPVVVK